MNVKFSWVAILVMLPVTGMWSQKVESQYDHGNDFRRYKTYAWRERKLLTQQSKQNQQLIDEALVKAVNTELQAKGLREENSAPDFYVTFSGGSAIAAAQSGHAYLPRDLAVGVSPLWTGNIMPGSVPNVWVSMEGMLLFEVTDAKTHAVVWSTFLKKQVKKPGKMPNDLDRVATEIAQKAFKKFPPKTAGK